MHTFIQNMSDLLEHVWKAAGLQHAYATDLPLCKPSSSQTSSWLTCIARCLPTWARHYSPADTYSRSTLCCQPNPSSAFHLSNLLSCSVMSTGQASAEMFILSQSELGASTFMLGIYIWVASIAALKQIRNAHFHPECVGSSRACLESCRITTCLCHRPPLVQVEQLAHIHVAHMHCTMRKCLNYLNLCWGLSH